MKNPDEIKKDLNDINNKIEYIEDKRLV